VCRIQIQDFGQCGRRKWRASTLADQTGNVITHSAFKNGDGFVLLGTVLIIVLILALLGRILARCCRLLMNAARADFMHTKDEMVKEAIFAEACQRIA
jgi:hypothetical protein